MSGERKRHFDMPAAAPPAPSSPTSSTSSTDTQGTAPPARTSDDLPSTPLSEASAAPPAPTSPTSSTSSTDIQHATPPARPSSTTSISSTDTQVRESIKAAPIDPTDWPALSDKRWTILNSHVNITLKSWSDTRWESRINSVEAVRYQAAEVRAALLEERFQALDEVQGNFGVLINFPDLPDDELTKQCETLSNTLSCGGQSDLDGKELPLEMQSFPHLPKAKMTTLELLAFLQEKKLKEVYPNMWVALRIAVTIPVTVAAAERSFSSLKLIKTYLRSTMG
ncbi:hypothetical protein AAFF_G00299960 [Aldrovandia affinis]|uniref:HAT C-terminal dimerisation domain-containing protein n=1 Tax=Aldrovandia affinis TaxID=143900 RepID=A0AAD7WRC3_9TELE|nr:hypothetical protein AAFF_G00299960 [Aldrovandia affinis]